MKDWCIDTALMIEGLAAGAVAAITRSDWAFKWLYRSSLRLIGRVRHYESMRVDSLRG